MDEIRETLKNKEKRKSTIYLTHIETELGLLVAAATDSGICLLGFSDSKHIELKLRQITDYFNASPIRGSNHHLDRLKEQLEQYFKGEHKNFDILLDLVGTEFQKQAWLCLLQIPYGCTTSYAMQAKLLGKPSAVRAVANANGKNKISIILPCHRVIGSDGALTGYGGGIWRKKKLLELEKLKKNI